MPFFSLIGAFFGQLMALASLVPTWNCQSEMNLIGNQTHFLYYGRDSWEGQALMQCQTQDSEVPRMLVIDFVYNSAADGFGADDQSQVRLALNLKTQMNLEGLKIRQTVQGRSRGPYVTWNFQTELNQVQALVVSSDPQARRSLKYGNLILRSLSREVE